MEEGREKDDNAPTSSGGDQQPSRVRGPQMTHLPVQDTGHYTGAIPTHYTRNWR